MICFTKGDSKENIPTLCPVLATDHTNSVLFNTMAGMYLKKNTNVILLDCSRANTRFFTFDLDPGVMVTQNVAQYPLHHVAYSDTKFEFATSNGLGGVHLKENTLFDLLLWGQGHKKVTSKVKGQIMYFLLNVYPSKLLDVGR